MANVWTQMGYVPPRGQCNYKQSIVSPRCPCLRFMLHPLKSSSSYECDGCNHHASFHSMENKSEDEIRKKWEQEAKDKVAREEEAAQRPKKRPRAINYLDDADKTNDLLKLLEVTPERSRSATRTRGGVVKSRRAAGTRAKSRITELTEEEEDVVELD
ncbi:uncharacterized protein EKO05_0005687 [Ascochyta rabiei]|uniref:uncharacterized protein n=1 Tax=Didymella rabiei TaxID=5454 RepID=UPI00220B9D2E|nr:uncharacterized protein EKO05_0005687 [Ascochyta rabiei]UPX15230.1 hypothetical protein EKO05_0005687 [Ascochyta rabiei]